jgi:hypothetical protein
MTRGISLPTADLAWPAADVPIIFAARPALFDPAFAPQAGPRWP